MNALVAAPEVLIPIQCEYYALEGVGQLLRNVELVKAHLNPDLHVSTVLLTMYDARTRLAAQVADEVRTHFVDDGAADHRTALGADLGGAELRPDGDDLRPGLDRRAVLPGGRPRDGVARRGAETSQSPVPQPTRPASAAVEEEPMSDRRRGLGRGLGALIPAAPGKAESGPTGPSPVDLLIPGKDAPVDGGAPARRRRRAARRPTGAAATGGRGDRVRRTGGGAHFAELPLDAITPNPRQPRTVFDEEAMAELVHSLREIGLLQPVVVRPARATSATS